MPFELETHSAEDVSNRQNWLLCWRWALWVLAAEVILLLIITGFAISRPTVAQLTPDTVQADRLQPQRSKSGQGACRYAPHLKTRDI